MQKKSWAGASNSGEIGSKRRQDRIEKKVRYSKVALGSCSAGCCRGVFEFPDFSGGPQAQVLCLGVA